MEFLQVVALIFNLAFGFGRRVFRTRGDLENLVLRTYAEGGCNVFGFVGKVVLGMRVSF